MPLVSILVPVYKVEKYIERCARSLFEQTFDDIEYIFVNDCTPDKSIETLKQTLENYPHRKSQVRIIDHPYNCGIGKTRTTALESASGKYIWHVDSDDFVATNAVAKLVDTAEKNDADFVTFSYSDVFADGRELPRLRVTQNKKCFLCGMLSGEILPYIHEVFAARQLYIDNRIFPVPGVNYGEDYALTTRLLFCSKKLVFLPDVLYFYCHANNESYCSVWKKSYIEQQTLVHAALKLFFADKAPDMLPFIELRAIRAKSNFYRMWALDKNSPNADLMDINAWSRDIPFLTLLKKAALPYKPLVLLGALRVAVLMRWYARFARFARSCVLKIFARTGVRL